MFFAAIRDVGRFGRAVLLAVGLAWFLLGTGHLAAARPSAMKLLPEETLLFVRTPNLNDYWQRMRESNGGRMVRDPQLAPFIERLYGSAGDLYTEKLAEVLGVSWEELQQLPEGEMAFAILARRDFAPAYFVLIDQGETPSVAQTLRDRALERLREQGDEITTESIRGVEVSVIQDGVAGSWGVFEKDNTLVASNDPGLLSEVLKRWQGSDDDAAAASASFDDADVTAEEEEASVDTPPQYSGRALAENSQFVTFLRHCRRPHDPPPNLVVYADPIGLLREFGRDNTGIKIAMATFPALGVDGLHAVGFTSTVAVDRFDGLNHMHLLLGNPRAGVMQVIAAEPGDTTAPPFVFDDLESYLTWNWNFRSSFNTIRALVDRFQFDGRTDRFVKESISERLGLDFEKDVIDNLGGRVVWMIGYEQPARFRGQQNTLALSVVDEDAAARTLATFVAKYADKFEERRFGDVTYQRFKIEWPEQFQEDPPTDPFLAVMDGYFLFGGSCQLFERAIAARDGTIPRLADDPAYQHLAIEVEQEVPGVTPVFWSYSRSEETLRQWYDLLTSPKTRDFLAEHSEGNPFFTALVESMEAGELPPFEVLAQYAAPSVGIIYDTDSGYHGIGFSLRANVEPTSP